MRQFVTFPGLIPLVIPSNVMQMSLDNRRRHERYISFRPARLELVGPGAGDAVDATLVDVSLSGALVQSGVALKQGQPLLIHLDESGTPPQAGIRALVVDTLQGPGYLVHCRFLRSQLPAAQQALHGLVQELQAAADLPPASPRRRRSA